MNEIDTSITHVTPPDGNVFADLGFPPDEAAKLKIKAQLMIQLGEWIKEENLKQEDAARLLQVSRPRVSDVVRGKTNKFTIDALVDMLEKAGKHVTVQVA
ncbi:MAG: XRE family transcriptional regulator [Chloroflexi bacterium]|nr:XRE family transcriptional regulator [Chloroflexota bacterium]